MKKFHLNRNLIIVIYLFSLLTFIKCFPCPLECICKPTGIIDEDFKRMNYIIDCTNTILNNSKLIYQAETWSIIEDRILDDPDDITNNDYIISIDLSNTYSLKEFNNQTIQLSNYSYSIQSLSLTNQSKDFRLNSNSFNSIIYQNLKQLNLSSCCQQIPIQCPQLFRSLIKLELLDLSGSDMYKTCLNTQDTISSTLQDLILRNNNYTGTVFSHTSEIFNGVRSISGKLDLQNSYFNMFKEDGNCLFDLFTRIKILDLSFIKFNSLSNNTEIYLKHLISCKFSSNKERQGEQLIQLYLRQLNLQYLPEWFTNDRFPHLSYLDLSNNNLHKIDLQTFTNLKSISLSYNPITIENIQWCKDKIYESINLRSTNINQTLNLTTIMKYLFQFSTNIDYSENLLLNSNLTKFPIEIDFFKEISLNLSQTNLYSFNINDISKFDDLYRLNLNSNYLIELNLEKQLNLAYLDCSNQKLQTLILNKDSKNLIEIKCSNNSLKTLENFFLFKHQNLKSIDLSYNLIESLENFFFSKFTNYYLQIINFKSNSIRKILTNTFHEKFFSLYSIDLSFNQINFIDKYAFQLPNLQILDLTNNPLKSIETNFLLTTSLRLFFIINNTQQLIQRCTQSKSNDNLLLTYLSWLEQNGTYMKRNSLDQQIEFDKCLRQYISRSKVKWIKFNEKHGLKYLSLYIIMFVISIGIILSIIYLYKKKQLNVFRHLQRYRPLDRNNLIEEFHHHQHEDDEIVMNLNEPPFNAINR